MKRRGALLVRDNARIGGDRSLLRRRELWILAVVTATGASIRFATLGVQSFDHDETATVRVLAPSLAQTFHLVAHIERSPPLFYALAWIWAKLFGTGQLDLRSLSALIGTVTIPIAFYAARELGGSRRGALFAAAFAALNPYLIWYSQEFRSYGLMAMFATLALAFFGRSLRDPSWRSLGGWAVASALAVCSHYFAAFLIAAEALWLLAQREPRRRALVATAGVAVVGLALLPLALHQQGGDRMNSFAENPLASRAGTSLLDFVASDEPDPPGGPRPDAVLIVAGIGGVLLLAGTVAVAVQRGLPDERRGMAAAGAIGAAAILLPLLLALLGTDLYKPHNLIGALPPLLLVAAIGFGVERGGRLGLAGAIATCALFAGIVAIVNANPRMQRPDWRGAASAIGPGRTSRIIVGPYVAGKPLTYYLGGPQFTAGDRGCVRAHQLYVLSPNRHVNAPGHGFRLEWTRRLPPTFTLRRYVAQGAPCMAASDLRLLNGATISVIQRPAK